MTTAKPKVSVLTPIYNTNPMHLRECIESILNQTFADFEFLILNDSPDNIEIEKIVKEYAKSDKRIKYFKNETNIGITPSRNKLLDLARGEYLAIFDHDDISMPNRLEKEVKFLDENPDIGAVSSWLQLFQEDNSVWVCPETDTDIRVKMTDCCSFYHTSAMIRKSVFTENNIRYEFEYFPAEDYRLWQRLLRVTRFYGFQEALVKYRRFSGNTSSKQHDRVRSIGMGIALDLRNEYPAHWEKFKREKMRVRYRLFGFIPFIKKRGRMILLFDFIPLIKLK